MSGRADDPLQREIDEALEGVDLQAMGAEDEAPRVPGRGGPPAGRSGPGGDRLYRGVVAGISGDDVIVELGPRMQGVVSLAEFDEPPKVGDVQHFVLRGREDDLWLLSMREAQEIAAWDEIEVGSLVRARVSGQNQGGLELKIGRNAAFMPASQVSIDRDADLASLIGQTLTCEVLEIDRGRERCVVSRRRVEEHERFESAQETLGRLSPGMVVSGKVGRIESFGAFVDLGGGLEGLIHVSNLSRRRIDDPADFVSEGQEVQVQVLEIKEDEHRIALGMKQLEPDPWEHVEQRLHVDAMVTGRVTRLVDFGAFVEVEPGLEGLLHVSQMSTERVRRPADVVSVGDEVSLRVAAIDPSAERLSLSRLDMRGALIGSDDAVDSGLIEEVLAKPTEGGLSTNLGALFQKALGVRSRETGGEQPGDPARKGRGKRRGERPPIEGNGNGAEGGADD